METFFMRTTTLLMSCRTDTTRLGDLRRLGLLSFLFGIFGKRAQLKDIQVKLAIKQITVFAFLQ